MSDQVRRIIATAPISRYQLSKETGVDEAVLSRFVNGKVGVSMVTLDKIGEALDLEVRSKRKGKVK